MRSEVGLILRLLGPLIEVAGIALFFQVRGRGLRVLGFPVESICYGIIGLGLGFVVTGLVTTRRVPKPKDEWDLPRIPKP